MSLHRQQCKAGNVNFALYTLDEPGDKVPMHTHTEETDHLTVVLKGSITVTYEDGSEPTHCQQGSVVALKYPHELTALEPETKLMNIWKH